MRRAGNGCFALLALTVAACTGGAAPAPSASPSTGSAATATAEAVVAPDVPLALTPADAEVVAFTDWAALRAAVGAQDVTSASEFEDKSPVVRATLGGHFAASNLGGAHLNTFAEQWGWDTFDAQWELTARLPDSGNAHLVRLREGIDVAPIADLYEERGFDSEERGEAVVYSHDLVAEPWTTQADLAVLNTAVLPDRGLLALAVDPEILDWLLAAVLGEVGAATAGPLDVVVTALGEATSWYAQQGDLACSLRAADPSASAGAGVALDGLVRQDAVAIGYRAAQPPVGLVTLAFADDATAQEQLPHREQLATDATIQVGARPFAGGILDVAEVVADGAAVRISGTPADGRPTLLLQSLARDDLLPAACPPG